MTDPLIVERPEPHVILFKLNRPEVRNALDPDMTQALADGLAEAETDSSVRVCIIGSSTLDIFSAGADIRLFGSDALRRLSKAFRAVVRSTWTKPLIAAVSGPAVGGGLELCLACDLVVAGQGASFALPEPRRGVIAAGGGIVRLPKALPRAIALELIVTGQPIDAQAAYRHGLANRLVPSAEVLLSAIELARSVAACSPLAVRRSLAVARAAATLEESDAWQLSAAAGRAVIDCVDAREGPRAFLEKRPPQWCD